MFILYLCFGFGFLQILQKAILDFISGYQDCNDGGRVSVYAGWMQAKPQIKSVAWSSITW